MHSSLFKTQNLSILSPSYLRLQNQREVCNNTINNNHNFIKFCIWIYLSARLYNSWQFHGLQWIQGRIVLRRRRMIATDKHRSVSQRIRSVNTALQVEDRDTKVSFFISESRESLWNRAISNHPDVADVRFSSLVGNY